MCLPRRCQQERVRQRNSGPRCSRQDALEAEPARSANRRSAANLFSAPQAARAQDRRVSQSKAPRGGTRGDDFQSRRAPREGRGFSRRDASARSRRAIVLQFGQRARERTDDRILCASPEPNVHNRDYVVTDHEVASNRPTEEGQPSSSTGEEAEHYNSTAENNEVQPSGDQQGVSLGYAPTDQAQNNLGGQHVSLTPELDALLDQNMRPSQLDAELCSTSTKSKPNGPRAST